MSHTPRPEPLSKDRDPEAQRRLEELTTLFTPQEILRGLCAIYLAAAKEANDDYFDYLAVQMSETAEAIDENLEGPPPAR